MLVYSHNGALQLSVIIQMNFPHIMLDTKEFILYDSSYIKFKIVKSNLCCFKSGQWDTFGGVVM